MKKTKILLIVLIVISVGFLSGCVRHEAINEIKDTDKDGYADDVDDFPDDSNLHKKIIIAEESYVLEDGTGTGFGAYVESDCKYVDISWDVTSPSGIGREEYQNISLEIRNPSTTPRELYYFNDTSKHKFHITINDANWGDWHFSFGNKFTGATITIRAEIYKLG